MKIAVNNTQPPAQPKERVPVPAQPPAQNPAAAEKPPQEPTPPPPSSDSFAYNATHCLSSGVGLVAGFGAGATVGAFRGLVDKKYDHQLAPTAVRITRVATAGVGALFGANAGLAVAGIPGAALGLVVGGLTGGVAGGAVVGLGEGLMSVAHGALDTGLHFGNKGHEVGGLLADKAFGKK